MNFEQLLDCFIEEASGQDPLGDYFSETGIYGSPELEKKIQEHSHPIDREKVEKRSLFFIPISRTNLKNFFEAHYTDVKEVCDFIIEKTTNEAQSIGIEVLKKNSSIKVQIYKQNEKEKSHFKTFDFINKIDKFEDIIESANDGSKYELKYCDPFIKFFFFAHGKITVSTLEREVSKLREEKQSKELSKMPINMFNVMLTNKSNTLEKIEGKIQEIEKAIQESKDEKKLARLNKQREFAKEILKKANTNFPEDFYFPVYQHYAIFGGMKLLHKNAFKPTVFTATAALEALNFSKINKSEVTELRKAFAELTVKRFPCYYVRQDKKDPNVYHFSDADTPIFMIYEEGRIDLNVDLTDDTIARKNLYLCLLNPALIDDLHHFFSIIDCNILARLRETTRVNEADLYFIEFLIREMQFRKHTQTDLDKICRIMKKHDWLKETGRLSRDRKRQIKDTVRDLLNFTVQEGLVSKYTIDMSGDVTIDYSPIKKMAAIDIDHQSAP